MPFFIVGSGRSGTTLVHSILAAHSQVAIPPETHFLNKSLPKAGGAVRGCQVVDLDGLLAVLRNNTYMDPLRPLSAGDGFDHGRRWRAGEVIDQVFTGCARSLGKTRWGEKTPHHLWIWRQLDRMFPGRRFLLVVRDGRDVACSLAAVPWASENLYLNAFRWKVELHKADALEESVGPDRALRVYYEDLVTEPVQCVQRLCRFLDLPYESGMLEFFMHGGRVIHEHERGWKQRNVQPLFGSSIGRSGRERDGRTLSRLTRLLRRELASTGRYNTAVPSPSPGVRAGVWFYGAAAFYGGFAIRLLRRRLGRAGISRSSASIDETAR